MNIIVLFGGNSPESEISKSSAKLIESVLDQGGYKVIALDLVGTYENYIGIDNFESLYREYKLNTDILTYKDYTSDISKEVLELCKLADIVFLATHGGVGEDGRLQAVLEFEKILYTGNGFFSTAMSMNKSISKKVVASNSLKVAREYDKETALKNFPVIIKPNDSGSSVDIKIIKKESEFRKINQKDYLVEEFVKGREFSVGVLGKLVLPPIEIKIGEGIYDFDRKYVPNAIEEICPANISKSLSDRLMDVAREVHQKLEFEVYSRSNFIVNDNEEIYFIEANSIPGMTPTSLLPKEAAAIGINFFDLCDRIINLSIEARENKI